MESRGGLGRLAPTPRLLVFVVLSIFFTLSNDWIPVLVALGVAILLLVMGGKYPRPALIACASAFVLTFAGHALTAEAPGATPFLIFQVSDTSMLKGLRLGLRLVAMILPAIAFIAVTPLYELLVAFRGLRIPAAADMYLTIVLRYVDILWYDIQISMKAMAVRGVNWEGNVRDRISAFRRLMLPLIFRILDHVDGQSLAIDNRGGISTSQQEVHVAADVPAVSIEHVFVRYDAGTAPEDKHALTDLSLNIGQGEATVLLGRIGAGKTSALLLCTGLIPKSIGRMKGGVLLFGHNTKTASLSALGKLSRIVFPSAVQGLVGLTVEDELDFSLRTSVLKDQARQEAKVESLRLVGLDESFLPRQTLGLSGGEMQRVALASAIVASPHLLVLDDVTVQLDPVGKEEVVAALQTLLGGRITTVITDPYVDLLLEIGDRFVSLEEGRLTGDGPDLGADRIVEASLRVPQLLRLGQAMGERLPLQVDEAAVALRSRVGAAPPARSTQDVRERPVIVSGSDLTYTYPDGPTAVKKLDLTFYQGEFVTILGSNGSGKTTLALLLAGALVPTGGTIKIEGAPYDARQHRGMVGYVFQEPVNQMVTMKVWEELAFGPQQLGWDEADVEAVVSRELSRFDLAADDVPLHLTPAIARKLSIAATLTMKPKLIILDEPTNNLDEDEVQHLMSHLKELQAGGTTVVLITHDVEVACDYADRVMVMAKGKVLIDGPTRQVMAEQTLLMKSDVIVPPVVALSLVLWPEAAPALTVTEMLAALRQPVESGRM